MPASENGPASAVEIRLEADDPDALHLVVDETRFDRVESGRGGSRNVFTGEIGGEAAPQGTSLEEFFVRVVNVSRDPAAYKDQGFRLIVTVFHEQIEIDGAPSSGNRSVDDPPVALSGTARGQYWGPYPSRQVRDAGLRAPCMLTFGVVDKGDTSSINFSLLQDGPLQAGDYGIAAYDPKEITGELDRILNFTGRAVVDFTLSEDHPLIGEYGMVYNGQGGVLRVDSISADWITGSARIAGAWSGRRPTCLPHDAPPAGPRNLEITLDFSIQNKPISSSLNIGSCVASPN